MAEQASAAVRVSRVLAPAEPLIMLVEDDEDWARVLGAWLQERKAQFILATSAREALDAIWDMQFIQSDLDGLLVDYRLPDASGERVLREFTLIFPRAQAALVTAWSDLSLEMWLRARRIPLFRKPLRLKDLEPWLRRVRSEFCKKRVKTAQAAG